MWIKVIQAVAISRYLKIICVLVLFLQGSVPNYSRFLSRHNLYNGGPTKPCYISNPFCLPTTTKPSRNLVWYDWISSLWGLWLWGSLLISLVFDFIYIYIYQLYIKLDNSIGSTQKKRLQNPAVCCVLLGPVGDCWLCNPIVSHYSAYSIKFHYL